MSGWSIRGVVENEYGKDVAREFVVYAENRLKAVERFQETGIKMKSRVTIEPATEVVETNLVENRLAPGA